MAALVFMPVAAREMMWLDFVSATIFAVTGVIFYQTYEAYMFAISLQKEK